MSIHFDITEKCIGPNIHLEDAPGWINELDNPYLHGVYAPTLHTGTVAADLEVTGELPQDLYGAYLRTSSDGGWVQNVSLGGRCELVAVSKDDRRLVGPPVRHTWMRASMIGVESPR